MREIECQLEKIFTQLSEMIVMDGEGATKLITINVLKSRTESTAKKISYAIANSNLFKTAMHGSDANWGRIIAKLGSVDGVNFTPSKVKLFINGILLFDKDVGQSSNWALQKVKSIIGAQKAGHTGTLDVQASGLLPICFFLSS